MRIVIFAREISTARGKTTALRILGNVMMEAQGWLNFPNCPQLPGEFRVTMKASGEFPVGLLRRPPSGPPPTHTHTHTQGIRR